MAPIFQTVNYGIGSNSASGEYTIILEFLYDSRSGTRRTNGVRFLAPPLVIFKQGGSTYTIENQIVNGWNVSSIEMFKDNAYSIVTAGSSITVNSNITIMYMCKTEGNLYLYNDGNHFNDITGGWTPSVAPGSSASVNGTFLDVNGTVGGAATGSYTGVITNSAIDFTDYKTLHVTFKTLKQADPLSGNVRWGITPSQSFGATIISTSSQSNVTVTFDVSSQTSGYLSFYVVNHYNGGAHAPGLEISKIWLTK